RARRFQCDPTQVASFPFSFIVIITFSGKKLSSTAWACSITIVHLYIHFLAPSRLRSPLIILKRREYHSILPRDSASSDSAGRLSAACSRTFRLARLKRKQHQAEPNDL